MKLVEIIKGRDTSPATLARAFDYVLQLGKYPIVVNDARGFFTSRVFAGFISEGMACLQEGLPAALIENAALATGMPVGPLAVQDEVSLSLSLSVYRQTADDLAAEGKVVPDSPGFKVVQTMIEQNRAGKAAGAGFYDYPADGKKRLWPGLVGLFGGTATHVPYQDVQDRLLYIQSIETLRCLDEGVLESVRDANIGSIFGFGFPPWSGGAVQFVHHVGLDQFEARALALEQAYGERFALPQQWRNLLG